MSARNKLENKANRRMERGITPDVDASNVRRSVCGYPYEATRDMVCNPLQKLTSKQRRKFSRVFQARIERSLTAPRDPAVNLAYKLAHAPLRSVIRTVRRSARRAASAMYILGKLSAQSIVAAQWQAAQDYQLGVLKQAQAELNHRITQATKA